MPRALAVIATWVIATAVGLVVAWRTRIGPVVLELGRRHGVHLADLVWFGIAYTWAAVATLALVGQPTATAPPDREANNDVPSNRPPRS